MKPLYTDYDFDTTKSEQKLPLICYQCDNPFYAIKKSIVFEAKHNRGRCKYCSETCSRQARKIKKMVSCTNCGKDFFKIPSAITKNNFCSQSCNATYANKNKSHGTRRSKLEIYLEQQLTNLYPNLHIDYNKKDAISSELDIYIPSLKLAFELNGIFHYEPIYGSDKLNQIKDNDISKSKACLDNQIDLCIIDSSGLKYFKPSNAQKYLDIIVNIINKRTSC